MREVIWLTDQRKFAFLISRSAYTSAIQYADGTIGVIENDDYELWEERAIEFESDADDDG